MWKTLRSFNISYNVNNLAKSDETNDYFYNIFQYCPASNLNQIDFYKSTLKCDFRNRFSFAFTDNDKVLKIINSITSKPTGQDKLSINLTKLCFPTIISYLTHLFKYCIEFEAFSSLWEHSLIIPLPKHS